LDNHYHVLGRSKKGDDLSSIFRRVHSKAAIFIREQTNCEKPVWWNYWDYCPRSEADYMVRLNYLLNNPLKHGYVTNLQDYPYSSFHQLFEEVGREKLGKQFRDYAGYKTLVLREAYDDDF
jgi:putative transposase